ncbi:hypothetical protein [Acaryochloris sp. IP29b_bin.137]|uniref:hypothetical protein n=1 Tax=Acaryochloris sp. IP29b_bin.137 TaxID=2969217 RepID=UPI00262F54AC|nr:hypothetical protein [Acaryochloris sp. IP29b_bin.137]
MLIQQSHLVLDACCVLNFSASGHFLEIIKAIPAKVVVSEVVKTQELITLQQLESEGNEAVIQFETAINKGLLLIADFESAEEEETFVKYVFELGDDGESATGAIAVHREWAIATDDKRAISFFHQEASQLKIVSTLEVIKFWADSANLSASELKNVLKDIRVKGRYVPHKNHPLLDWWQLAMQ